jgi:hypothetical protein
MKRWLKSTALVLVVLAVAGYWLAYPSYSWHQKLTIEVETPNGVVSGSSVVAVTVDYQPTLGFLDVAGVRNEWQGEAAVVDLPDGRKLFALLGHPVHFAQNTFKAAILGSRDARFVDMKAYYGKLRRLRKSTPVPAAFYPLLVTFDDVRDPKTVKRVAPDDLAKTFGAGFRLKAITLAITGEPVTKGRVEKVLGWVAKADFVIPPKLRPYIKKKAVLSLRPSHFIDGWTLKEFREGGD